MRILLPTSEELAGVRCRNPAFLRSAMGGAEIEHRYPRAPRCHPSYKQRGYLGAMAGGFHAFACNDEVASGSIGTSITPGASDAKGSWAEIMSDTLITDDAYGIAVWVHSNNVSATARPTLVDIGFDPTGGTTWQVLIPDLNACCAGSMNSGVGAAFSYYFPLFIKAGTALAARAQVGDTTAGTLRVVCKVYMKPSRPEQLRFGSWVQAIGIDSANSRGTLFTPGTASYGSWTTLGTGLAKDAWWWQASASLDDTAMNAMTLLMDIGAGTTGSQRILLNNMVHVCNSGEVMGMYPPPPYECVHEVPAGTELWARGYATIASNDNESACVYALGG